MKKNLFVLLAMIAGIAMAESSGITTMGDFWELYVQKLKQAVVNPKQFWGDAVRAPGDIAKALKAIREINKVNDNFNQCMTKKCSAESKKFYNSSNDHAKYVKCVEAACSLELREINKIARSHGFGGEGETIYPYPPKK